MKSLSAFKNWSKFKRGMAQVNFLITMVNVSLSAFTALFLAFSGLVPAWLIVVGILSGGSVMLLLIWKLGDWDWKPGKPNTLYRADIKVDPYCQANIESLVAISEKVGADVSMWGEWTRDHAT
jgi:hypothetical protein